MSCNISLCNSCNCHAVSLSVCVCVCADWDELTASLLPPASGSTTLQSVLLSPFHQTHHQHLHVAQFRLLCALQRVLLDTSLGFSAGVMLAASYWSLLAPSIEMAEDLGYGDWAFVPAAAGFATGAYFVHMADEVIGRWGFDGDVVGALTATEATDATTDTTSSTRVGTVHARQPSTPRREGLRPRRSSAAPVTPNANKAVSPSRSESSSPVSAITWRRTMLLVAVSTAQH